MLQTAERLGLLDRMARIGLDESHTSRFDMATLSAACARLEEGNEARCPEGKRLQAELIQNNAFEPWYWQLKSNGINDNTIATWLSMADDQNLCLTSVGTADQFLTAAKTRIASAEMQFMAVRYFPETLRDKQSLETLVGSLNDFQSGKCDIAALTDTQRAIMTQPFFHAFICVERDTYQEAMRLLEENKPLCAALSFLYEEYVDMGLDVEDLRHLTWMEAEDGERFAQIFMILGDEPENMSNFMGLWLENGALRFDLEWFARHRDPLPEDVRSAMLESRLGYLNTIYGGNLNIPFEEVSARKLDVLLYAIAHKQKHFLSLVSQEYETFSSLSYYAMLFEEDFYRRCNLNSLSAKDLAACEGEQHRTAHLNLLPERQYTFQELKLLHYAEPIYIDLFKRLEPLGVDRRMVTMRELLKKGLLSDDITSEEMEQLAQCLLQKPLNLWRQQDFAHIQGLAVADAVGILRVYDKIAHLLPSINSWEEAAFAIRNVERVRAYEDWSQVKAHIMENDRDWANLVKTLGLTEEFISANRPYIERFLFNEGAEIAMTYYDFTEKEDAFRRIVQAELMGQLNTLKYYPDDLEKEISYPVTEAQQTAWQTNTSTEGSGFRVAEVDDFYSTMRMGELPHRTCLHYQDGMYRECLLCGFDSNKKILLAWRGNEVVARAVIRLTKGTFYTQERKSHEKERPSLEFADLMKDQGHGPSSEAITEHLTLFLEHPYFAHINDRETEIVKTMFVSLMRKKAQELGALSVLAHDYSGAYGPGEYVSMRYSIYISKSKAGAQYLDSLTGAASVSDEDSYRSGHFYVAQGPQAQAALEDTSKA